MIPIKHIILIILLVSFHLSSEAVKLTVVGDGFITPVDIAHAGDERIFIVEQHGIIQILNGGDVRTFLDIQSKVQYQEDERGLLGIAFHPDYRTNGFFYINYTDLSSNTVIARYTVSENANEADVGSEKLILAVDQPFNNHNGGVLKFGPDSYLYIGLGDGGSGGDPRDNGQNRLTLLGKILRIDVDIGDPYSIPPSNPFANEDFTLDEIWTLGLRNPWRFSFDRLTGDLFIGDVGQNAFEEVDYQESTSPGGINYGWRCFEGFEEFDSTGCQENYTDPIYAYNHSGGNCSITGGYVYRGQNIPSLQGKYIYSDFCTGIIWALTPDGDSWANEVISHGQNVSTFGEDAAGELYFASHSSGEIFRIDDIVTSVEDQEEFQLTVSLSPNPTKEFISLDIKGFSVTQYKIISLLGQDLLTGVAQNHEKISLSPLTSGTYMIIIQSDTKKVVKKFVIAN